MSNQITLTEFETNYIIRMLRDTFTGAKIAQNIIDQLEDSDD